MIRRLAPTLAVLALGLCALAVGSWGLQRIFAAEREEGRFELTARRRALEHYAKQALERELTGRLAQARAAMELAARDPLADERGLYLREQDEQRLPRTARTLSREGSARQLHATLPRVNSPLEADDPFLERVALFAQFEAALGKGDRRAIERTFRAILAHRVSFVAASTRDVPFMLALLERFVERSTPDPSLLRALLRDGLPGLAPEGLQRQLLRRRDRFGAEEFAFLCARLATLSRRVGVPAEDLEARCAEEGGEPLGVPARVDGPSLLGAQWYLEPGVGGAVRGVALELGALLEVVQSEMRDRGLLGAQDGVKESGSASATGAALRPLSSLGLQVESPAWAQGESRLTERYRIKSALLIASGLSLLGILLLAAVGQRRKHRYLELRQDFISTVSHELRTPLASVRVMAETLEKRVAATPGARDYPSRIIREVDSLGFLVENILSFNRLDKNRWVARQESVALEELGPALQEAAACTQRQVQLSLEGLKGVVLQADRELLKMLFSNLVRNACKYNTQPEVKIAIGSSRQAGGWRLEVQDNGVGIPPKEQENVFKDFYRLSGGGVHTPGSGLGLALCRRIMQLHQGEIRVGASSPQGTTFVIDFPGSER